jgi:sporulation protein YlmC with PRC-barrel domain
MKTAMITEPREMTDRPITDSNGHELGRIREVEQEARTGRYSTLHIEVDARNTQKIGVSGMHHLPLNTDEVAMDRDSIRASRTIEALNSQFANTITVRKAQHGQHEFIDKAVYDMNMTPLGTIKDIRTSSGNGEFDTILVELDQTIKMKMSMGTVNYVRIKLDHVDEIGQEVRLDRTIEELGREWNEIILHR